MLNMVQKGRNIDYVASLIVTPSTIAGGLPQSGEPCLIGDLAGVVASTALLATDLIDVQHTEVFNLPVVGATTVGARIYADPATLLLSTTNTGTFFGHSLGANNAGTTNPVPIRLKH